MLDVRCGTFKLCNPTHVSILEHDRSRARRSRGRREVIGQIDVSILEHDRSRARHTRRRDVVARSRSVSILEHDRSRARRVFGEKIEYEPSVSILEHDRSRARRVGLIRSGRRDPVSILEHDRSRARPRVNDATGHLEHQFQSSSTTEAVLDRLRRPVDDKRDASGRFNPRARQKPCSTLRRRRAVRARSRCFNPRARQKPCSTPFTRKGRRREFVSILEHDRSRARPMVEIVDGVATFVSILEHDRSRARRGYSALDLGQRVSFNPRARQKPCSTRCSGLPTCGVK